MKTRNWKKQSLILAALACAALSVSPLSARGWFLSSPPAPAASPSLKASSTALPDAKEHAELLTWCHEVEGVVRSLRWPIEPCDAMGWRVGGHSVEGRPLVYAEFGDLSSRNVSLIFATVHGDEVTPLYLGVQLAHWLKLHRSSLVDTHVVLAPLLNPDGFFHSPRTRMNANGVDLNRNFPTHDWNAKALAAWRTQYHSDKRRFPGNAPGSEPETQFQQELIRRVKPQKILSIHAPLNFLDYDGPSALSLAKFPRDYVRDCLKLRKQLRAISNGFFPGSLGNYSGQEMGIPTLTLELPSADPNLAERYWRRFSKGIHQMIQFNMPDYASRQLTRDMAESGG